MTEEKKMEELKPCPFCGMQPFLKDLGSPQAGLGEVDATPSESELEAAYRQGFVAGVVDEASRHGEGLGDTPSDAQVEAVAKAIFLKEGRAKDVAWEDADKVLAIMLFERGSFVPRVSDYYRDIARAAIAAMPASPSPWRSMESIRREALEEAAKAVVEFWDNMHGGTGCWQGIKSADVIRALKPLPPPLSPLPHRKVRNEG